MEHFEQIFSPEKRTKMAGESISGRHIADKQRQLAQRAMHAGEMSSFEVEVIPALLLNTLLMLRM